MLFHMKRDLEIIFLQNILYLNVIFLTLSSSVLDDLKKFTKSEEKIFIPHPIYDSFGDVVDKKKRKKI